jgi:hypothetical protein
VVEPAKEQEVVEPSRTPIRPVAKMMGLAHTPVTARESAAAVAVLQSAAQRRRYRPGTPAHVEDRTIMPVGDVDCGRVAGEPPGRFRGNADGIVEGSDTGLGPGRVGRPHIRIVGCRGSAPAGFTPDPFGGSIVSIRLGFKDACIHMKDDLIPIAARTRIEVGL